MKKIFLVFCFAAAILVVYYIMTNANSDQNLSDVIHSPAPPVTGHRTGLSRADENRPPVSQRAVIQQDKQGSLKTERTQLNVQATHTQARQGLEIEPDLEVENVPPYSEHLNSIIQEFETDQDQEKAIAAVNSIKENLHGENLQRAMKLIGQLGDAGGNDALVETFLDPYSAISDQERLRILSYLDPEYGLSEYYLKELSDVYYSGYIEGGTNMVLMTIASSGGDQGAELLIEMADAENDEDKYRQILTAISRSGAETAMDYLHRELDRLAGEDIEYQDQELIKFVRSMIQRANAG